MDEQFDAQEFATESFAEKQKKQDSEKKLESDLQKQQKEKERLEKIAREHELRESLRTEVEIKEVCKTAVYRKVQRYYGDSIFGPILKARLKMPKVSASEMELLEHMEDIKRILDEMFGLDVVHQLSITIGGLLEGFVGDGSRFSSPERPLPIDCRGLTDRIANGSMNPIIAPIEHMAYIEYGDKLALHPIARAFVCMVQCVSVNDALNKAAAKEGKMEPPEHSKGNEKPTFTVNTDA